MISGVHFVACGTVFGLDTIHSVLQERKKIIKLSIAVNNTAQTEVTVNGKPMRSFLHEH